MHSSISLKRLVIKGRIFLPQCDFVSIIGFSSPCAGAEVWFGRSEIGNFCFISCAELKGRLKCSQRSMNKSLLVGDHLKTSSSSAARGAGWGGWELLLTIGEHAMEQVDGWGRLGRGRARREFKPPQLMETDTVFRKHLPFLAPLPALVLHTLCHRVACAAIRLASSFSSTC